MIQMLRTYWRNMAHSVRHWCLTEPWRAAIVILACVMGGWLRLFLLPETMMFMGDQGRDAMIVSAIWRKLDPVFIGPVTSVGNMYLGPFYYYFMLPWLWLSYPSPLGPVIAVALVNTIAIGLVYFLGQRLVGKKAALIACVLTAISAVAATYSRFSWNPNLSLIFSVLTLYFIHASLVKTTHSWRLVALLAGILIQLHYVNLILVAVAGFFWLLQAVQITKQKQKAEQKKFWLVSMQAVMIFVLTCVPLFLFDWKHGWLNFKALGGIFTAESSFADTNIFISVFTGALGIFGRIAHIFTTLSFPKIEADLAFLGSGVYWMRVGYGLMVLLAFIALVGRETITNYRQQTHASRLWAKLRTLFRTDQNERITGLWILLMACVFTIVALAFYRHSVFDHYVLYFLPVLFLVYGCLLTAFSWRANAVMIAVFLIIFAFANRPSDYLLPNGLPYRSTWDACKKIVQMLPADHHFDFILIDGNGDLWGEHYRYFFESLTDKILPHDQFLLGDDFIVIDEMRDINLYDNPSYELVFFRNLPEATYELMFSDAQRDVYRLYRQSSGVAADLEEDI